MNARLCVDRLTLHYGSRRVLNEITLAIADGAFTAIVGPNGCGKSTLLKTLLRLLVPREGRVLLDGRDLAAISPRTLSRQIALLPQGAESPEGLTVEELVLYGRAPHQSWWGRAGPEDQSAVTQAMAHSGVTDLAERQLHELSGGQRQRAWLAMVLAQETAIVLLDEPTTFLDINHQHDLMELLAGLKRQGRTLVAVLHDLNQAARYADVMVAMGPDGRIYDQGPPQQVMTVAMMQAIFGLTCHVDTDPVSARPRVTPLASISEPAKPDVDYVTDSVKMATRMSNGISANTG